MNEGYDRGMPYTEIKPKLIATYTQLVKEEHPPINKLMYLLIAMIQLANGSRISEACVAFEMFLQPKAAPMATVKISKSQSKKKRKDGTEYETRARYRQMKYPGWVEIQYRTEMQDALSRIGYIKNSVLNYLIRTYGINTHTLRYSFINHQLYHEKKEPALISKFVGHSNLDQIVRYTSKVESNKIFDNM